MFKELKLRALSDSATITWLGPLPTHWATARGKVLFRRENREPLDGDGVITCFRDGLVTLRSNRRLTGFTEAVQEHGYQRILKGDLVIHAMDAFAGAVGVSDSDGKSSPVYAACTPRDNANTHYYAAVVREMARTSWIAALSKGVRERSTDFRFESLANQKLPAPPADEQAAIVKYLGHAHARIDRAIAAKRKLIALLEEQKQAIIHQTVTRGLDPSVPIKDSGVPWLGEIPEHWGVVSTGAVSHLIQTGPFGSQLHAEDYVDGGTPVINPSHLKGGTVNPDNRVTVDTAKAAQLGRHAVRLGDILAARRGELGRSAVVKEAQVGWLCGTGSLILRLNEDIVSPIYYQIVFSTPALREDLESRSVGSTMANLSAGTIARMRVPVPPLDEQKMIVDEVAAANNKCNEVQQRCHDEIELLREFRTRLTSDVVTGQVDVREIVMALPELTDDLLVSTDDEIGDDDDEPTESKLEFAGADA